MPDVPTIAEAGGPTGLAVDSWLALMAPRGTPPEVVRKINAEVNRQLADPDVLEQMRKLGFEAAPGTPEDLAQVIAADDLVSVGDPVTLSGSDQNAGQGALFARGKGALALFLVQKESTHELWGASLKCQ